jgi:hypothetical protein
MGAFDLIVKSGAKGAKKAAPFFSKADVLLDELQRGKGTGNEFMTELIKKGAKPTELRDRGLEKVLKDAPKMTKAEAQKLFEQNPPPRVKEEVRGGNDYQEALDQKAREIIGDDYATFDDLYGRDAEAARYEVNKDFGHETETKYDQYRTPGGENYREILLKLPKRGLTEAGKRSLMNLESDIRRGKELSPTLQKKYDELKAQEAAGGQDYQSTHFDDTPNILAHIRVQDFISPTYTKQQAEDIGQRIAQGMGVANHNNLGSGSIGIAINKGYVTPKEAAQYADFRKFQGEDTTGARQKILLVDEIQSDWHQEGRKKGYKQELSEEEKNRLSEVIFNAPNWASNPDMLADFHRLNAKAKAAERGVPDAPFKKNWHELAMKRVLDYAAENGYDSIAITPGAEQAKRYDLSKHINDLEWDSQTNTLTAWDHNGVSVINEKGVSKENLSNYVGKEVAERLLEVEDPKKQLFGADLQVGGEGMKGFYDKILLDYLNNFGKPYGASVGQMDLSLGLTEDSKRLINDAYGRGTQADIDLANAQAKMQTLPVHRFDITPQLRDEVKNKGLPMYGKVAMPALEGLAAGTGAATIGSEVFDTNNEQQVQNPVHFTENPDAMLLELMQRN